jgi:hypothetical protein
MAVTSVSMRAVNAGVPVEPPWFGGSPSRGSTQVVRSGVAGNIRSVRVELGP